MTGNVDFLRKANVTDASVAIEGDQDRLNAWLFHTAVLERDYAAAERYLGQVGAEFYDDSPHLKLVHEALLAVARGADQATVTRALASACQAIETRLAPIRFELGGTAAALRADLALLYAFLGRKDDAIREGRAAIELVRGPIEKSTATAVLALVYTRTGESEEAITLIERLLTVPILLQYPAIYDMTLADLKHQWVWDPLRSNPRFQKIVESPEPKTAY